MSRYSNIAKAMQSQTFCSRRNCKEDILSRVDIRFNITESRVLCQKKLLTYDKCGIEGRREELLPKSIMV